MGSQQIVQLTSLRPTADLFCALLRDALKIELQKGRMKSVKGFVKTCYSEVLVSPSAPTPSDEKDEAGANDASESSYHGGLGLKFRFPGDPKK